MENLSLIIPIEAINLTFVVHKLDKGLYNPIDFMIVWNKHLVQREDLYDKT